MTEQPGKAICDYSVDRGDGPTYGRLYYGEAYSLGKLEYEIVETRLVERMPDSLTYPDIQPVLFERVCAYLHTCE